MWNPSTCACECDEYCKVGQYLDYNNCVCRKKLIDDLIEQCTSIVDIEIKNGTDIFTSSTATKNIVTPDSDNSTNIYLFLFVAVLIVAVLVAAGFIYYYRKNNTTKLENNIYDVAYSGAGTLNF